jgi:hypothetical protein
MQAGDGDGSMSIKFESIYDDCTEDALRGSGGLMASSISWKGLKLAPHVAYLPSSRYHINSEYPVKCLVYDANLPMAISIANQLGVSGTAFFTIICCYCQLLPDVCGDV